MTLSENNSTESHYFPTHAAYLIPVEIKDITQYGEGQKGVFAIEHIPKGTKLWVWTHRVVSFARARDGYVGTGQACVALHRARCYSNVPLCFLSEPQTRSGSLYLYAR